MWSYVFIGVISMGAQLQPDCTKKYRPLRAGKSIRRKSFYSPRSEMKALVYDRPVSRSKDQKCKPAMPLDLDHDDKVAVSAMVKVSPPVSLAPLIGVNSIWLYGIL